MHGLAIGKLYITSIKLYLNLILSFMCKKVRKTIYQGEKGNWNSSCCSTIISKKIFRLKM